MSRTIVVKVSDSNGYGLRGYKVKTYGGDVFTTESDGKVSLEVESSSVTIYVNGTQEYSGSTSRCPSPLIVNR